MTERDGELPALGTPDEHAAPDDDDFAGEHDATTVDQDVTADRNVGEPESSGGWSGLDRETPP